MARPARTPAVTLLSLLLLIASSPAGALTARSVSDRVRIDGFSSDFTEDERVFGINLTANAPEESSSDSKWGPDNDVRQIRITWDADSLYFAGDAVMWGNNLVILIDAVPNRGIESMASLSSWRRNFSFADELRPDLFAATWDGNTSPRLLVHTAGSSVDDLVVGESGAFRAAATFSQSQRGRSMELAIPWNVVFLGTSGLGTAPRWVPSLGETLQTFPPGAQLKIVAVVTGGGDGSGGPDSAPDNTQGHSTDGNANVLLDNYAIVDLDRNDDTGLGGGGPDGVADWGVEPKSRITFRFPPPIVAKTMEVSDLPIDRPAFAPDRGERVSFTVRIGATLDPADPIDAQRTVSVTAEAYDFRGRLVRRIYANQSRLAINPADPGLDFWDGRNSGGEVVEPGIYMLRVVLEPNVSRHLRPVVVVR